MQRIKKVANPKYTHLNSLFKNRFKNGTSSQNNKVIYSTDFKLKIKFRSEIIVSLPMQISVQNKPPISILIIRVNLLKLVIFSFLISVLLFIGWYLVYSIYIASVFGVIGGGLVYLIFRNKLILELDNYIKAIISSNN